MGWTIPRQKHTVFQRNPLVAVVVELRFYPILKVAEKIAEFQDLVRTTFPAFQDVTRQVVDLQPAGPVEVRNERMFNFMKADASSTLSLATSTLMVESRRHERREHYMSDMAVGIEALTKVCGPVTTTRLGLRYVDLIDKELIERELSRKTTWQKLVAEPFLAVPTGHADLNDTNFACEVASTMPSGGGQTVRYGLAIDGDKKVKFRLDVDRFIDQPGDVEKIVDRLASLADDTFAVFVAAMGPDLRAWMSGGGA
jgi:uncharacterized protein (TIGR04255 family)